MAETPHPTDVEVARALNALVATLNDHRTEAAEAARLQAIVTGSLGGEERILVRLDGATAAALTDHEHKVLARVERRDGRWVGERVGSPLSGGYIPSTGGAG
jgi:hypothetical protein